MEQKTQSTELIEVVASVRLISSNCNQKIGEFSLDVGGFSFRRISDEELRVSFSFKTNPIVEDEHFGRVFEMPHQDNRDLMTKEAELDSLLDLLSLSEDIHLRVDHDTYGFTYRGGSIGPTLTSGDEVEFKGDAHLLGERFDSLKASGDGIIDSLRFYRLSKLEFDGGEEAVQLWNIFERLYGEQPGEKYLSREEMDEVKGFLQQSSIPASKHEKVLAALNGIHPVSVKELYAGKIKLKNQDGTPMSLVDKKKMFGVWKELRNYHGHGTYILRNEALELELFNISDTVELFLESKVLPRLYHVVLFETGSLPDIWQKSPSTIARGDWNAMYSRGSDRGLVQILKKTLHNDAVAYVVYPNCIVEVREDVHVEIDVNQLPDEAGHVAASIQADMYKVSDEAASSDGDVADD